MSTTRSLDALHAGQAIPFGGSNVAFVSAELADAFTTGDRLVVVQASGDLLHIPAAEHALVDSAVGASVDAFTLLAGVSDAQLRAFYDEFAARLLADEHFAPIAAANAVDVASAFGRGRSTTRLELTDSMRSDMAAGLLVWRDAPDLRDEVTSVVQHEGWSVTARRAPLGVVGFVFEGRPNVFADATGVLRSGNTAVLRIGSDALGTARAIVRHALDPALRAAGLPEAAVTLLDSPSRSTGWALFADTRLALAIARGSGDAVTQLGAVARQSGVPASLHGTGGSWMIASREADAEHFAASVRHSLDRKVCNTLNVCCIVADRAADLVPTFIAAAEGAAASRGENLELHVVEGSETFLPTGVIAGIISVDDLATEWEWENRPEVSLVVVDDIAHAVRLFNTYSPRLEASLISADDGEHREFYATCHAPFIGNGFTRWVDGQFALDRPELGLSNWQGGRLFARSAVLSGDSVFTVRLVADVADSNLHR